MAEQPTSGLEVAGTRVGACDGVAVGFVVEAEQDVRRKNVERKKMKNIFVRMNNPCVPVSLRGLRCEASKPEAISCLLLEIASSPGFDTPLRGSQPAAARNDMAFIVPQLSLIDRMKSSRRCG